MRAVPRVVIASPSSKAGFTFPSAHRLHAAAEFSAVFASRRILRGRNFDLLYLRLDQAVGADKAAAGDGSRLGLVIAKRFARRAVLRNLVKRLAREAFRQGPSIPSCDVVLRLARALPRADRAGRQAWRMEIDELLMRLNGELRK